MKTPNKTSNGFCCSGGVKALLAVAGLTAVLAGISASAATLVLETTDPTPGSNDVYNFTGPDDKGAAIAGGDATDYVATGRPTQGQYFTTPSGSGTYLITDIWARHCGYVEFDSTSGNGTWWTLSSGAVDTIRVTDPSKLNQAGFAMSTETYTATGTENAGALWTGGNNISAGDNVWVHFTLQTPISLKAGTQYGFDLTGTVNGSGCYWEWLGSAAATLAGGQAYTGPGDFSVGNSETLNTGNRVFLVHLTQTVPQVAPVFTSASRFASVGQPVQITVIIPQVVNANNTVTLNLASDNASIAAFSLGGLATKTLTFASGATNAQTFTAYVLGTGSANLVVVTNASFSDASVLVGSSIAANEPFDYDPNVQTTLDGANGGSGFGAAWADANSAGTIVAGLTYGTDPSLVVSTNAVTISSAGQTFRPLASTYGGVGGGTVWISFMVQGSGLVTWGGVSLFITNTTEQFFMGEITANSPNNTWGFLRAGGSYYMSFANSVTPGSQTDFLVYRIDFPSTNGGQALVSFYADPALSTNAPFSATGSAYVDNFTFDTLRLGTGGSLTWGEIRMGTSWTNVVPFLGTPAAPALPIPDLSVSAKFLPIGQTAAVTVSIPAASSRPLFMTITNSNPTAFSLSSTNAASTSLTFGVGATNVQTLNVQILAAGGTTLTVVSNSTVNTASISFASQVSAGEEFQYAATADGGLAGADGGFGFTDTLTDNPWAGGGGVTSPGLTYPGLLTSSNCATVIGTAASGTGNGTRTLSVLNGNYGGAGGGTVWISFLIQGAFPSTPQYAYVTLLNNGGSTGFSMGLDTSVPNNGKWGYQGPGAGETGFANSVVPSTNTDLLVYRLDFPVVGSSSLPLVTFYADPPVGSTPPTVPTGVGALNTAITFNGVQIGTDFNMNFDEIRVGGSWAEVVPSAAAPSLTPSLTIVRTSSTQVQISWPIPVAGTYTLLSSTNVLGPWSSAGLSVSTSGGNYVVTDTISGSAKFYRLQKQ
jgi:hypothetical protein